MGSLTDLENYAQENNIPIIQKPGIEFIKECIKKNHVQNILEIGAAIGYSTIQMALVDEKIHITTIERDYPRYLEAVKNIHSFNLDKRIKIINDDALNIDIEGKFDLIFIDAAKAQYIKFFEKYKHNLTPTGIIISDNLNFHGLTKNPEEIKSKNLRALVRKINKYRDFLENNQEFNTIFYNIGDGIAESHRKGA